MSASSTADERDARRRRSLRRLAAPVVITVGVTVSACGDPDEQFQEISENPAAPYDFGPRPAEEPQVNPAEPFDLPPGAEEEPEVNPAGPDDPGAWPEGGPSQPVTPE
jgi:hypothetical protein